jgi:hypothetical protein
MIFEVECHCKVPERSTSLVNQVTKYDIFGLLCVCVCVRERIGGGGQKGLIFDTAMYIRNYGVI